jgi:hypothetical protein
MTTPVPPKYPVVCFAILGLTLLLGGLGTLGGFVYLYFYFPDSSTAHTALILAVNGLLGWALAILCALSAWRLFKQIPKARSFALVTWALVAGFTLWILLFDGLQGWSHGGIVEVVTWGVLEALIGLGLMRAGRSPAA